MKKILVFFILLVSFTSYSQTDSLIKKFRETFQQKYFSIGVYIQTVGDYQIERTLPDKNSFNLTNARLKIFGEFDEGFGYYLQTNFINAKPILDAYVYHKFSDALRLDIGQFKAPFSAEYLTSSSMIDFVNRSQAANTLGPKRQTGIQIKGNLPEGFAYAAGIFNGNGINVKNDNNNFLYAGRVTYAAPLSGAKLVFGVNAAFSKDTNENGNFDRTLFGGDFRLETEILIFSGEFIQQKIKASIGRENKESGYYLAAGYKLNKKFQVLGRYDVFNFENTNSINKLIIIGLNYFPTDITKFQFNYVINSNTAIKQNQILLKAQIAF